MNLNPKHGSSYTGGSQAVLDSTFCIPWDTSKPFTLMPDRSRQTPRLQAENTIRVWQRESEEKTCKSHVNNCKFNRQTLILIHVMESWIQLVYGSLSGVNVLNGWNRVWRSVLCRLWEVKKWGYGNNMTLLHFKAKTRYITCIGISTEKIRKNRFSFLRACSLG